MRIKNIAIIGLGLMGASLAAACRRKYPAARITGVSRKRSAVEFARRKKWVHAGTTDLRRGVADADLIVLCTPVDTFKKYLQALERAAKPGAIVTDVGSVKTDFRTAIEKKGWKRIQFVSAHPFVGSHECGVRAAIPGLYEQGVTFLIRSKAPSLEAYRVVKRFWTRLSARVIEIGVLEHDILAAEISHLPHVVAACLVLAVRPAALRRASSGFRDATRIAQGNPAVWLPIIEGNRRQISLALKRFEGRISQFRRAFQAGRGPAVRQMLRQAARRRSQI